jgi:sec-independent protein translocase protein TatB
MGIGFGEMVAIAVIALIFLGPEKFPDFAKLFVRAVRDLRNYVDDVKSEVAKEILPVKGELQQFSRMDPETYINKLIGEDDEKKPESQTGSDYSNPYATSETATPQPGEGSVSTDLPAEPVNDAIAHATGNDVPTPPAENTTAATAENTGASTNTTASEHADGIYPPERMEG